MLFRTSKGNIIEINKYDYINDNIYHNKIFQLKKEIYQKYLHTSPKKLNKTFDNKNNQ